MTVEKCTNFLKKFRRRFQVDELHLKMFNKEWQNSAALPGWPPSILKCLSKNASCYDFSSRLQLSADELEKQQRRANMFCLVFIYFFCQL